MPLDLIVVTPQGEAFSQSVEQVVLPGVEGEFGVLESHENFLTSLRPGAAEIKALDGSSEWIAVSDGFAEVTASKVVVLVDECLEVVELDAEKLRGELAQAEEEFAQLADEAESTEARAVASRIARTSGYLDALERSR